MINLKLLKVSIRNSVQVVVKLIVGILNIKIIALSVGAEGMALLGLLNNFLQLSTGISSLGLNKGVVKYLAQYKNDNSKQKQIISTSAIAVVLSSVVVASLILIFEKNLSMLVFKTQQYYPVVRLGGIYVISASILNLSISISNGLQNQFSYINTNIIASISSFSIIGIAVYYYGIDGLLYAQILAPFPAVLYVFYIVKNISLDKKYFSANVLRSFKKFSYMAITSAIVGPVVPFLIRHIIIKYHSLEMAGLWDGMNKLSSNYQLFITASCAFYLLPKFSELETKDEIRIEVNKSLFTLVPLLVLGAVVLFVSRHLAVVVLFTDKFFAMTDLFQWQVLGDQLKIISWLFGILLIAMGKSKIYIVTEVFSAVFQVLIAYLLMRYLSEFSCTLYYFIENIFYLVVMILVYLKYVLK